MTMTLVLLVGIVLTVVPATLIAGFSFFIMYNFFKDDDEAAAIMRLTFVLMGIGIALIAAYFISQSITA